MNGWRHKNCVQGGGGGVKNPENFAYVLFGWPLRELICRCEVICRDIWFNLRWISAMAMHRGSVLVPNIKLEIYVLQQSRMLHEILFALFGSVCIFMDDCCYYRRTVPLYLVSPKSKINSVSLKREPVLHCELWFICMLRKHEFYAIRISPNYTYICAMIAQNWPQKLVL